MKKELDCGVINEYCDFCGILWADKLWGGKYACDECLREKGVIK